jgi:hypothetical protein
MSLESPAGAAEVDSELDADAEPEPAAEDEDSVDVLLPQPARAMVPTERAAATFSNGRKVVLLTQGVS